LIDQALNAVDQLCTDACSSCRVFNRNAFTQPGQVVYSLSCELEPHEPGIGFSLSSPHEEIQFNTSSPSIT
jgi:hypothetical protein